MEENVLDMLEELCDEDVFRTDYDMDLFEADLLDSLGFAELLVTIEERFGIIIAPSEITREDINTPNKIIHLITARS